MSMCKKMRTMLIKTGKITSGGIEHGESRWETRACETPLFTTKEIESGICRSCASGWAHPNNYPAGGPRPEPPESVADDLVVTDGPDSSES